jgi:O-antigen/teichoic acid export membrane protein
MAAETIERATVTVTQEKHHVTFFRQSGWMMIASMAAGALMYAVHMIARRMPKEEYGLFTTLLQVAAQIGIPAVGLQGVFTQQAAGAMTPQHERELAGVFRGVLHGTFFIWVILAVATFVFRDQIQAALKISNPAALWMTVLVGLATLWRPIVQGVMQGRQNFLWLGNIGIMEGVVRFAAVWVIVGLLGNYVAGAMLAVLIGFLIVMVTSGWFCRDCFRGDASPMDWPGWLRRVVPLTLGLGAGTFMLSADMVFVRRFFSEEQTGYYAAAGMIGRALVYFTMPMAMVMFPKLARSKATGEKSHALELALGVTALAGAAAALGCTIFPSLPLRVVYDKSFLDISTPLVPWFAWCMLPLTLATVLLNSLMARSQFNAVPWLVAVAVAYGLTLYFYHKSFTQVIQTLGIFSVIMLAVCVWYAFFDPSASTTLRRGNPSDGSISPP